MSSFTSPPSTRRSSGYQTPRKSRTKKLPPSAPKKSKLKGSLFNFFDNKIQDIQPVGGESANGFVAKVTTKDQLDMIINGFTQEDQTHFILKSVQREDGRSHQKNDNPMYEFEAGLFVNTQLLYFPCFLRTYTLFYYGELKRTKDLFMNYLKSVHLMNKTAKEAKGKTITEDIKTVDVENQTDYTPESCANKNNFAVLMDYFDGANTLYDMMNPSKMNPSKLQQDDIAKILFQIYAPLYALGEETFQHKDLHTRNIMVKDLGFEVTFTYLFDDEEIVETDGETKVKEKSFRTKYLAKMIDYGRCYIPSTQEYLDQYNGLDSNQKKQFEYMLNECGLVHVLFDNSDLSLYKIAIGQELRSIEMVLNSLIERLPSAQKKDRSVKKTRSNRKKQNSKKNTRTKKMKGADRKNTLTIDCKKYPTPSRNIDEQPSKRSKKSRQQKRQPMIYNGTNTYIHDMISNSGDAVKELYNEFVNNTNTTMK